MARDKEKREGEGFAIAMFLVLIIGMLTGMAMGNVLFGCAIGLGTVFFYVFSDTFGERQEIEKIGSFCECVCNGL